MTESFAAALTRRLGSVAGAGIDVSVAVLGLRDELDVPAGPAGTAAPAVPVHLAGRWAIIGPLDPGSCARCLARRWQRARNPLIRDALELGDGTSAVGDSPYLTAFAVDAVASVVEQHLAGAPRESPYPVVYQVDLGDLSVLRVRLVPDPDCPACGRPVPHPTLTAVPELAAAPRSGPDSFRVAAPRDFDLPLDALVNPVCGALGGSVVAEIGLPTTASLFGSITERDDGGNLYEVYWGGHAGNFEDSLRIGILEGLERYAGLRPRGRKPALVAAYDDLAVPALDPRLCGMYGPEYREHVPEVREFSTDREIAWVQGYSLRDQRPILVPRVLTYYHCDSRADRFVQECSNGCASGGSAAEAILFGLTELIERDAFLLAWYGKVALPEIDPRSSRRAETRAMVERLAMYGYRARFFDTRLALPVPVITAVAERTVPGLGSVCFGAGASLDPESALAASLDEIATDALHLRGRTEWDEAELRAMAADFGEIRGLHDHPRVYGLPEMAAHAAFLLHQPPAQPASLADAFGPTPARSADIRDDLARCVALVADAGFDTIVVDQTTPEQRRFGLHTASVIVPGLVPIDFGWHRQRVLHMPRVRAVTGVSEPYQVPHPFP